MVINNQNWQSVARPEEGNPHSEDSNYIEQLSLYYKQRLLKEANLDKLTQLPETQLRQKIETAVNAMIAEEKRILSHGARKKLIKLILDESVGYGPLEPLLNDDNVTEIMVNNPNNVYVEKNGNIYLSEVRFKDHNHIRHIIDRIIAPIGRRIDESSPMVDGRLPDGSRINAVIPPISLDGPAISIRKFNSDPFSMANLVSFGTLPNDIATFLEAAVKAKLNLLISGGTGSGKTTFLNVLSSFIPAGERIITIEDMAELKLEHPNLVRLESRPPNMEGTGEIAIRQLVVNALRMRPDRIIVGEVRSAEAMDMLQAMNTGHEGSLTTIHANSTVDALSRLEAMIVMHNESISVEVVRKYILSAIDLIVQQERLSDGSRKVVAVSEINTSQNGEEINDIFNFKRTGVRPDGKVEGKFTYTGNTPSCLERIKAFGQKIPDILVEGEPCEL